VLVVTTVVRLIAVILMHVHFSQNLMCRFILLLL